MKKLITLFLLLTLFGCGENNPVNSEATETSVVIESGGYAVAGYLFDKNGNMLEIVGAYGDGFSYEYDENNNLIRQQENDCYARWIEYFYDKDNNLILETSGEPASEDQSIDSTKYVYKNGKLSERISGEYKTLYSYDENGNLKEISDDWGVEDRFFYDENNNLIKHEDSRDDWIKYTYDGKNRLIKKEKSYDPHDDEIEYSWTTFAYNSKNQIIKQESYEGDILKYSYDKKGRLTKIEVSGREEYSAKITYEGTAKIDPEKIWKFDRI